MPLFGDSKWNRSWNGEVLFKKKSDFSPDFEWFFFLVVSWFPQLTLAHLSTILCRKQNVGENDREIHSFELHYPTTLFELLQILAVGEMKVKATQLLHAVFLFSEFSKSKSRILPHPGKKNFKIKQGIAIWVDNALQPKRIFLNTYLVHEDAAIAILSVIFFFLDINSHYVKADKFQITECFFLEFFIGCHLPKNRLFSGLKIKILGQNKRRDGRIRTFFLESYK